MGNSMHVSWKRKKKDKVQIPHLYMLQLTRDMILACITESALCLCVNKQKSRKQPTVLKNVIFKIIYLFTILAKEG